MQRFRPGRRVWAIAALALSTAAAVVATGQGASAAEDVYELRIKDHKFAPGEVEIPAGKKVKLLVKNLDATPEEFESHDLDREKVIPGGQEALIIIGPLDAGRYEFVGEFHEDSARGWIVVK